MGHFAPAYQQASNDAWLNEMVGDIASRASPHRSSSMGERSASLRSWHTAQSFARGTSEGDGDCAASKTAKNYDRFHHGVNGLLLESSDLPLDSPTGRTTGIADEDFVGSLKSPTKKPAVPSKLSKISPSIPIHSGRSPTPTLRYQRKPDLRSSANDNQHLPQLERRLSDVPEFTGFDSHPAVRPLESRVALGEAAGPTMEDDSAQYPGMPTLIPIVIGICLSVFIISLDRNIITTAIPDITADFHSYDSIGWYGSAYLMTASAFQPLYGRIYMSFATKSTFLVALAIFQVGSIIVAACPSSDVLIVGRAIQGVGSAGLLTGAFVVATHAVRIEQRPVLFALVGILYGVGALCGPLLGGALTDTIGWRWCFWINLPIGALTFLAVLMCFKPKNVGKRPSFLRRLVTLDWFGNLILLGAMAMLFLALQFSEERYSWSSARSIGLLCGFGATTLIFAAWLKYRGESALIPPRIIKQRTVAASCGAAFLIYGALLIHSYYLPVWFQAVKGTSAVTSGVNMVPYMAANALFSLIAGVFVSKNGLFAPPSIIGCAIGTIGSGLLATIDESVPTARWVGFQILTSVGLGMAIQQGFSAVQAMLPLEEVPIGTAAVVASQSLGGAIFVSVGNTLLQNHLLNQNNEGAIPGVNIRVVFELGATQFRDVVPPESLPALIALYNDALRGVFIAAVPLCGSAFLCSLLMEWRSMRRQEEVGGKNDGKEEA
ncbi:hypothetical protein LTR84_006689 [Exophiala bonariae]|uniref:Major facilitator superfamily (MFS) profile domain-containing protein n=1 Tax=Exophiala bonariae TaxID=1690606 RepID=A0AAV9N0R4_9EURO|nr:hypothetical protein LTR84_006689 [Exophiala bonariae]